MGYWLMAASGPMPLQPGDNIVGRDPKARVWLDSPSVSRHHARIGVGEDGAVLEDLGSKNGTRVRGTVVTGVTPLADGDELRFGSVGLVFRAWTAEATRTEGGA